MNNKKIGTLLLTGLITGSMMGSGIIFLPPLANKVLGDFAIFAWILIIILGALFAKVFAHLAINFPGEGGVSLAVEEAFGKEFKKLTSYFLICAVLMGPTALLLTAGEHLSNIYNFSNSSIVYALGFIVVCAFLMIKKLSFLSKITLFLSGFIAIILLIGSISSLLYGIHPLNISKIPSVNDFGTTILILFWAVIGWEVIGSYSNEVKNPQKTINKSIILSFFIVNTVYFLSSYALQNINLSQFSTSLSKNSLTIILFPAFGKFAVPLMSFTSIALCISTYLLFVGSVARLITSMADEGYMPKIFIRRTKNGSPLSSIIILCFIHSMNLLLSLKGLINLEKIVSIANLFFICNALMGILASMKLYKTKENLIITGVLSIILLILLWYCPKILLSIPVLLIIFAYTKTKKQLLKEKEA